MGSEGVGVVVPGVGAGVSGVGAGSSFAQPANRDTTMARANSNANRRDFFMLFNSFFKIICVLLRPQGVNTIKKETAANRTEKER